MSRSQVGKRQSGRILLRIPVDLHEALVHQAQGRGVSLNQHVSNLLASHVAGVNAAEYCFNQAAKFQAKRAMEYSENFLEQIEQSYPASGKPGSRRTSSPAGHTEDPS